MLVLVLAVVVLAAPGMALLLALGIRRPLWWIGLSAPVSIGVATVTASFCAAIGVAYGPVPLGLVTLVLLAVGGVRLVRSGDLPARSAVSWSSAVDALRSRLDLLPGIVLVVIGIAASTLTWMRGLGSLDTILQEHDMISHGVITAYIDRTGNGAPWELMPADVLTGQDVTFYPSGMHLLMAVIAALQSSTVVGVNAISVATLAIGWTSGSAALGYVAGRRARLDPGAALVAAGVAAIVASGLYRPAISLVQWGGILANAVTLSLTPGLLAVLLSLPRRGWSHAVAAGVGCAGLFAVHATAGITVGVSLVAWWMGEALGAEGRRRLREQLVPLALVVVSAAVAAAPAVAAALAGGDSVSGFEPDISAISFADAFGRTVGLAYNTGDPRVDVGSIQLAASVLCLVGVVAVALTRRGVGAVTAWLVWVAIVMAAWTRPGQFPQSLVTNAFYDAQTRVWAHVSLFVPPLAGLGVVMAATTAAGWLARRSPAPVWRGRAPQIAIGLAVVVALAYTAVPGRKYARTDTNAVASRYGKPDVILRFSDDDRAAGEWLAARVKDGERVLNSGNDGSTLLYVDHGLPIVNVSARGTKEAPATWRLMKSFNTYPDDPEVRGMLKELNVRWVYVDSVAPTIAANGAPEGWVFWLNVAPGFTDLNGLPGLERVFRSGTVSIYELDLARLQKTAAARATTATRP